VNIQRDGPGSGIGTAADLHASASKITGLADFGPDDYTDGLDLLLGSYAAEAQLTQAGRKAARAMLRGALTARLLSEAGWRRNPDHAAVRVSRPVFVTGLPRTGTTALHRLLTADPAHQGLELWLAEAPQPRPPRDTWPANPVFQLVQAGCERHHVTHPEFIGVHYLAADQVEECWQLLRQSMRSVSFECLAHLPGYSSWLHGQDWTAAYRRHRRNLQLIGLNDTGRRWVLKNPSHLFALDALLAVYPDALVIQTHREPAVAIASACSLAAQASAGWSDLFTGSVIGRDMLELWADGLDRFRAVRAGADQASFCDVDYEEFVADPLGTVESVYARFGMAFTGRAADAMRRLAGGAGGGSAGGAGGSAGGSGGSAGGSGGSAEGSAGSAGGTGGPAGGRGVQGKAGVPEHRYALSDFGLTVGQVNERFAGYLSERPGLVRD
jgi:Sulfotransferase family